MPAQKVAKNALSSSMRLTGTLIRPEPICVIKQLTETGNREASGRVVAAVVNVA